MTTVNKILTILSDGKWHSGEELGKILSITRAGVWKAIGSLPIVVERSRQKGYRIPGGIELYNKKLLNTFIDNTSKEQYNELIILDSVGSTNEYLFMRARHGEQENLICLTEEQTHGQGRRGRSWESTFGHNICCSFLWHFPCDPAHLSGLSQLIAICTVRAIEKITGITDLGIKWPNDIFWQGKKLAGVLIDLVAQAHFNTAAVIGVGINVKLPDLTPIAQPWTDLNRILNTSLERNHLTATLINEVIAGLEHFQQTGLTPHLPDWQRHDICLAKPIKITLNGSVLEGISEGITHRGEQILRDHNNQIHIFISGDASLSLN